MSQTLPFHLIAILMDYVDHKTIDNLLSTCQVLSTYKLQVYKTRKRDLVDTLQTMFRSNSDQRHLDHILNNEYTFLESTETGHSVVQYGREPSATYNFKCVAYTYANGNSSIEPSKEFVIRSSTPHLGVRNLRLHGNLSYASIFIGCICFDSYVAKYRVDSTNLQNHVPFCWTDLDHILPLVKHHTVTITISGDTDCYLTYETVKLKGLTTDKIVFPIWCNQYTRPSKFGCIVLRWSIISIQLFHTKSGSPFKSIYLRVRNTYLKSQFEAEFQFVMNPEAVNDTYFVWTLAFGKAIHFCYKAFCILECYNNNHELVAPDNVTILAKNRDMVTSANGMMSVYYKQ